MISLPIFKNYIAGHWCATETTPVALTNPNNAELTGYQANSSTVQVEQALDAASQAFHADCWSGLAPQHRAEYLQRIARLLEQKKELIAQTDSLQNGVVIQLTRQVASICAAAFRAAADLLQSYQWVRSMPGNYGDVAIQRLPLGVAAIITPWNAPSGIACHKIASALAAGCCVIFKPSEWAAGSAQLIAEAIAEADLPQGVFQLLHGNAATGALLVDDSRVACVSFTGGAHGGAAIGRSCGEQIKPVQLELGGNNPLVVLKSADLDKTAAAIVTGMITMNAQWCRALGRILVHQDLSAALLDKVLSRLTQVVQGNSLDEQSQMGPLVHKAHWQHIAQAIESYRQLGAQVLQPVKVADPQLANTGYFLSPTLVLGLAPEQTLEEIFGPVACWHTFASESEAIALANQTPYGLAAYVFGEEQQAWQIADKIRSGMVKINAVSLFNLNPMAPRPAWGKSGLGDEGALETFSFFLGTRVIGVAG